MTVGSVCSAHALAQPVDEDRGDPRPLAACRSPSRRSRPGRRAPPASPAAVRARFGQPRPAIVVHRLLHPRDDLGAGVAALELVGLRQQRSLAAASIGTLPSRSGAPAISARTCAAGQAFGDGDAAAARRRPAISCRIASAAEVAGRESVFAGLQRLALGQEARAADRKSAHREWRRLLELPGNAVDAVPDRRPPWSLESIGGQRPASR